ncbi:MAG TPA: hypothetical protein VLA93_01625 [Pyrinomonadaceae bacterium]|nr:hypothetical protein [Pyrinomonadaceae bacterium]
MRNSFVRISLITVIFGLVVFGPGLKSYSMEQEDKFIDVLSFHWGVTQTQFARVCLVNTPSPSDTHEIEQIAFTFVQIEDELGQTLINRALPIPANEVRCTDLTYRQLDDSGLGTEPSGRKQFLIDIVDGTSNTPNTTPSRELKGSIETIDVNSAQTRIYQGIHWRFDNVDN